MDHSFSIGATRHHHHSAGNPQQFRVSPVNFPGAGRNATGSSSNNASQPQLFNSASSLFGSSGGLPRSVFGRGGGGSSNYLNSPIATNHFNFPLRSNTMTNRPGFSNISNNPVGPLNYNRGGRGGSQSHPHSQNVNKSRQQPSHNLTGTSTNSTNQPHISKNQSSHNNEINGLGRNLPGPQYRIFKRGDSIPGISSPLAASSGGANPTGMGSAQNGIGTGGNSRGKGVSSPNEKSAGGSNANGKGSGGPNLNGTDTGVLNANGTGNGPNTTGTSVSASNNKKNPSGTENWESETWESENSNSQPESRTGNGSSELGSEGKKVESQDKENKTSGTDSANEQAIANKNQPNKTPVSLITDIAKCNKIKADYRLIAEKGPPHSPTFTVLLHLGTEEYTGQGSSIKRAQHAAAAEALEKTALSKPVPRSQPKRSFNGTGGKRPNWAILQLTSIAEEMNQPISIVQEPVTIMDPFRRGDPPSKVSVHVGENVYSGEGNNFNAAKNMAAVIALKAMIKLKQELDLKKLSDNNEGNDASGENKSPISVVHEMAMKRGLAVTFDVIREEGPPHNKVFTVVCSVGGEEHTAEGQGPTKQAAKKAASELMTEKMSEIPIPPPTYQVTSLKAIQRGLFRQKVQKKKTAASVVKDLEKQTVSPISRLIQIAHIRKFKEPEFNLVESSSTGVPDEATLKNMSERERRNIRKKKPSFTIEVIAGPHCSRGTGPNKKAAKKAAAEAALLELGYGPIEPAVEEPDSGAGSSGANATEKVKKKHSKSVKQVESSNKSSKAVDNGKSATGTNGSVSLTSARQIVPGVLVLSSENKEHSGASAAKNTDVAQEMSKVNSLPPSSSASSFQEGIDKLAYLANLFGVPISYSDFPKKDEFLSVVSFGTNPTHVAHGCGATLEEAQNSAALKVLTELSDQGIDNVKSSDGDSTSAKDN